MSSTSEKQKPCYLMALSPELRNAIWHCALPSDIKINTGRARELTVNRNQNISEVNDDKEDSYQRPPALLQVSQQIRSETAPIYYASNTFVFDFFAKSDKAAWKTWWAVLGANARHIRKLDIYYAAVRYSQHFLREGHYLQVQHIIFKDGVGRHTNHTVEGRIPNGDQMDDLEFQTERAKRNTDYLRQQFDKCMQSQAAGEDTTDVEPIRDTIVNFVTCRGTSRAGPWGWE